MRVIGKGRFIEGILFFTLSIIVMVHAFGLHSFGEWALSPALFPLIVGSILMLLSLILLISSTRVVEDKKSQKSWLLILASVALTSFYVLILPVLHFEFSTPIYSFLFLLLLGVKRLWILCFLPIGITLSIYYILGVLAKVVLP